MHDWSQKYTQGALQTIGMSQMLFYHHYLTL